MEIERTLVLIKPDGVNRNLSGKIIDRFENSGLNIKAMKLVQASIDIVKNHYPLNEEWAKSVFNKTKIAYEKMNRPMEYKGHLELGKIIISRLQKFLLQGPVVAIIIEGENAILKVREMVGHTEPKQASPGTIRKDFAPNESYELADGENRALRNLIHASDAQDTALREINVWFKPEEIHK
jgi:nucleoside-diphosphate kinase